MAGQVGAIYYKEVNFDTADRVAGTIQNPQFAVSSSSRIKQIQLVSAEIPFTWYVFTNANNKIDFVEPLSGPETSVVLPPGNYSSDDMIAQLSILMTAASPNGYVYTFSINPNSSRIIITSTGNFNLLWATGANQATSIRNELGFAFANKTLSNSYTADFTYNLSGDNYIYIKCDQVLGFDNAITNSNPSVDSKILAKVPVLVNSGEVISYSAAVPVVTQLLFNDSLAITQLTFSLTSRNNIALDTNNRNWSFTLGVFT
jgi:hypothetical protein